VNQYIVKVSERDTPDRYFKTAAFDREEARYHVKSANGLWDWERYYIRIVNEVEILVQGEVVQVEAPQ
jgi:hypothetical protein